LDEPLAVHAAARVEDEERGEGKRLDGQELDRLSHAVVSQLEVRRRETDHRTAAVGHEDVHVDALDVHREGGGRRRLCGGGRGDERESESAHDSISRRSASSRSSTPTEGPHG
jgi:hypothetical protein